MSGSDLREMVKYIREVGRVHESKQNEAYFVWHLLTHNLVIVICISITRFCFQETGPFSKKCGFLTSHYSSQLRIRTEEPPNKKIIFGFSRSYINALFCKKKR